MLTKLACLGVLALGARAQDLPLEVKYNLTGFAYPRVGQLARVQGTVSLELIPHEGGQEVKMISGPDLLVAAARNNLAKWRTNQPVTVNYIFKLAAVEMVNVRVPRSNAFGRVFLRMFHLPTFTEEMRCQVSSTKPSTSDPRIVQQSPLILEIEITGSGRCAQTETSLVASRQP
jgi:hypothetical protein